MKRPDSELDESLPEKKLRVEPKPLVNAETVRTGLNILHFALKTLSGVSSSIPVAGVLSSIVEPLLDITDRIEQTSANAEGFVQLATRIERHTPIVTQMAQNDEKGGQTIVEALQQSATPPPGPHFSKRKSNS
ncbi:hypothetical protein K438DRAFT_1774416 [Mycena galopus ATCC 62051]|nr:hypothetical protein K438DRAFT_1774416 [Mycena galopus ATCC 62051]